MEMYNILLYFFSTISQVLATIIALVFVFIIFRLSYFEKVIDIECCNFADMLKNNATVPFLWIQLNSSKEFMINYEAKHFSGISTIMRKICDERKSDNADAVLKLEKITEKTKNYEREKQNLISKTKHLCLFGFFVIILSISMIPFVKIIENKFYLTTFLFSIFILLSIISLVCVYRILANSFNQNG